MPIRRAVAAIVGAATVFGVVVLTAPSAQAAATLPSGFSLVDTPSGQAAGELTDIAYLPGGDMLTTGRKGAVYWIPLGGQPVRIATIPVSDLGELGLTGIAVASDYAVSRTVYTIHAVPLNILNKEFRLSKWKMTGTAEPTGLAEESILLRLPVRRNVNLNGIRDVAVDPTGTILWVAVGDSADVIPPADATANNVDKWALRAMDPAEPTGKILRIRTDGRGADDNPYFEPAAPSSWRSRTHTSGLRNPRITLDPRGGVIVTDTGWAGRDEVNLALPGQNMKWPCWEGTQRSPGYRDLPECAKVANNPPLHENVRTAASTLTGGVSYTGTSYPAAQLGAHFIADKGAHTLSTLRYDPAGKLTQAPEPTGFASEIGDPVSVVTAPNGDIVYADAASAMVRRLTYPSANKAPTAAFNATIDPGTRTVTFDAGAAQDVDRDALTYRWDFGDGTTGTGRVVQHTYASPGPVTIGVRVADIHGATATTTQKIIPGEAGPELVLVPPSATATFAAGDTISVSADATDTVDGPLDVRWSAERVRCLANRSCVTGQLPGGTGADFSTGFPNETDAHVVITATTENSRNVIARRQYIAKPRLARLTLSSSQTSQFTVGTNEDATRLITVGSTVRVTAPATALDGSAAFTKWTDTQSPVVSREVKMNSTGITLKAEYTSPIHQRYATDAAVRERVGAPVGSVVIDGQAHHQLYTAGRLYWTPQHNVTAVHGPILDKYVALGAHAFLGAPSNDQTGTPDGIGQFNHFTGTPETGLASIYWTQNTGANAIYGDVRAHWAIAGFETWLGYPTADQARTPDKAGQYVHFTNTASIYSHPTHGTHHVLGNIRQRWAEMGWEAGIMGYPTNNEAADGDWRYTHFSNGSIYWHPNRGALDVYGAISTRWVELGREDWLGYPTTRVTVSRRGDGLYNDFTNGASIYWSPGTGAHEVIGAIRARWEALGLDLSYLGLPISGEYDFENGSKRRSDFQGGYIVYDKTTHVVTDHRW